MPLDRCGPLTVSGRVAVTAALTVLLGCSSATPEAPERVAVSTRGPSLTAIDSIVLEEPDSVAIGRLTFLARDAERRLYVSDYENGRVLRFAPSGALLSVIGRMGSGPGELGIASTLVLLERDSILGVMDGSARRLSLFATRTGAYLRSVSAPFGQTGHAWSWRGDTAFFAVHGVPWFLGRWVQHTDSIALFGAVPPRLLSAGLFYLAYGRPEAVRRGAEFIVQVPTEPGVQIFDLDGLPVGHVALPAARRRGTPPNLIGEHMRLQRAKQKFQFLASAPIAMHLLASGHIAILEADIEQVKPPPKPEYGSRYFLSLLSPDLSQACLDAELWSKSDAVAPPVFVGDTVYVLSRLITESVRVRNMLHAFRISPEGCEWIPTGGRQASRLR